MARNSFLQILLMISVITKATTEIDMMRTTGSNEHSSCKSVEAVPLCANLGYVNTTFPNLRGHTTPEEANEELSHFMGLISTGCSNAIVHLLCSIYAPMCIQKFPNFNFPPCKNLCESVRDGCADMLLHNFGYSWPPGPHLDCQNYDTVQDNRLCFGPSDPSTLKIPPISNYHDPPQNFRATPLSPSTVKFTWEPTEESTNEVFILTCEPQPYQFPVSTTATTLKSGQFTPHTEYTCTIFTAHTADIDNSSATVHFRTERLGAPRNFQANHQSPHFVQLTWDHPDRELPKIQQDNYLYILLCTSTNSNLQLSAKGGSIDLLNLQESTEYTCHLSILSENETATITFTTLETLKITFIQDTPSVLNNTVRLKFITSRPATKITCRIIGHSRKQDCSNHRAVFQNIPRGTHKLQIIAENNRRDKLNYKTKLYVSGTNSSYCAVNLINDRIAHKDDNSVLIHFKGTNFANQFDCRLNKQTPFRCYSPLFLRRLQERNYQLKITPTSSWCQHSISLLFQFTV